MSRLRLLFVLAVILTSCRVRQELAAEAPPADGIEQRLGEMTLRDKVGQLFIIRPEDCDYNPDDHGKRRKWGRSKQAVTPRMEENDARYPAGGFVIFERNIKNKAQLECLMAGLSRFRGAPLFYVDEEGGGVSRLSSNRSLALTRTKSMTRIGASGDTLQAFLAGQSIGKNLKELGFHVNFAPVADVWSCRENQVLKNRCFGSDPAVVASMVVQFIKGSSEAGVACCAKHFPGHGATRKDTHKGYASVEKDWEAIDTLDIIPFAAAIRQGVPLVMVAHINYPQISGDAVPASLSPSIVQGKLREELGFEGVIVTDAMNMGAITSRYSPGEAAVLAIQAGCDLILNPDDYFIAFDAVLDAVEQGVIPENRIDASVRRILRLKSISAGCYTAGGPCP